MKKRNVIITAYAIGKSKMDLLLLLLVPLVMVLVDRAERKYWKDYKKKMGY